MNGKQRKQRPQNPRKLKQAECVTRPVMKKAQCVSAELLSNFVRTDSVGSLRFALGVTYLSRQRNPFIMPSDVEKASEPQCECGICKPLGMTCQCEACRLVRSEAWAIIAMEQDTSEEESEVSE